MTQIIEYPKEVVEAEREFEQRLTAEKEQLEQKEQQIREQKEILFAAEALEPAEKGERKKELSATIRTTRARIKQLDEAVKTHRREIDYFEGELAKLRQNKRTDFIAKNNKDLTAQVFEDNNIHYVVMDQQWWSVDGNTDRRNIKINASDSQVIQDLIFYESDWEIKNEQELKRIAKEQGRMFKHIVRDFGPDNRPGIYNQMKDIRRYWLQPRRDRPAHPAFRILCLSIAGGDDAYADQLERFVAYRYCHPEDTMVPNIDSCATGGTGRDTFYNILRTIFTDECCGSASEETFKGTHNGDLFGKMIVKVDEKNSGSVPIDKIKELTGSTNYRHRAMNKDARDVVRLFSFFFFRNGYTTTARLAGTGSSGEDRRFEPVIARINLTRHLAYYHGLIEDINQLLDEDQERAMTVIIKDWQRDYYKNEEEIALWLGDIIDRHRAEEMTELLPLHGIYYKEMIMRQRKGLDIFMPKLLTAMKDSTVIAVKDAHKLFETAESHRVTKDWFKNQMLHWLNSKQGWDAYEEQDDIYPGSYGVASDRRRFFVVKNRLAVTTKPIWNIEDFIDPNSIDDKGNTVGNKITQFSIRDELK